MKSIKYFGSMFALVILLFTSCTTEETGVDTSPDAKNSAQLTFGALLDNLANRAVNKDHFNQVPTCSDAEPDFAEVTFSYLGSEGDIVVEVEISQDSNGYFTEYNELLKIPIAQGSDFTTVTLKGFKVYDSNNILIWISPVAPGNFAGYIDRPLPFNFDVYAGTKPYINVEVLCFDRRDVNEYGYPFFDLAPGKIYPLCFFANLCIGDTHFVGDYTVDLFYNDGSGRVQLYTSGNVNSSPTIGFANGNYFANPLCLVVPDKPDGFLDSQDYLFYVITPKDWIGNYGDVNNTPLAEEGLNWNDVNSLLNTDGQTNEYIHLFIGCDVIPGCISGTQTPGDIDGDCIPNNDDNCPDTFNPNQADGDSDGVGDVCDACPSRLGTGPNGCMQNEPCIGSDPDGDGFFGECDNCPEEFSSTNQGCPADPCITDSDGDGLNDCIDDCPNEAGPNTNNGCPVTTPPSGCGTAYMFGNTQINSISNSNRWGWAENFNTANGTTQTFDFWRGAGQNDTSKGIKAGTVTITATGDKVQFVINLASGFSISNLHVYLSEESPGNTAKSPGKYNRNDEVGDSATSFILERTSSDSAFWVIVHAGDTCN